MISAIELKSDSRAETLLASEFWMPSATPIPAATPMAGAPRTTMLRMTSATCSCVVQVT